MIHKSESFVRFTAGGVRYQISTDEVERVLSVRWQAVTPIPFGLGKRILGLFSFRGVALPLVRAWGAPPEEGGDGAEITALLLGTGDGRFALAVDFAADVCGAADPDAVSVCAQALYEGSVKDT